MKTRATAKKLFSEYCEYFCFSDFAGVQLSDLPELFKIRQCGGLTSA